MQSEHDDIKNISGRIYLVKGRVIELDCDDLDPDTDVGRAELLRHADTLFTSKFEREPWPGLTAAVLLPKAASPDGRKHVLSVRHFGDYDEKVKQILRKEFPDRAGMF